MQIKIIVIEILDKLDREYGEVVKKKRKDNPQLLLGSLIEGLLKYDNLTQYAQDLNLGNPTLSKIARKALPEKPNTTKKWSKWLLALVNLNKCSECGEVKVLDSFTLDNSAPNGRRSKCKECIDLWLKDYRSNNRGIYNATAAKRRAAKLQRTVSWADLEVIKELYKNCPKGYHVDHIIPLQGKNVSGLHVENNLQYLIAKENIRKSNKF